MLAWAHNPRPLPEASLNRFVGTVKSGWQQEGGQSGAVCEQTAHKINELLRRQNLRLKL
jgi:hypothetical protein